MNIFPIGGYLDDTKNINWKTSAFHLDDLRLHKMHVETCQLLSTSLLVRGALQGDVPCRLSYQNHPCALWVSAAWLNHHQMLTLATNLSTAYFSRFGSLENYNKKMAWVYQLLETSFRFKDKFPQFESTPLPLVMPDEFRDDCVVESYRRYFASKKNVSYVRSLPPDWFVSLRKIPYKGKCSKTGKTIIIEP